MVWPFGAADFATGCQRIHLNGLYGLMRCWYLNGQLDGLPGRFQRPLRPEGLGLDGELIWLWARFNGLYGLRRWDLWITRVLPVDVSTAFMA